MSVSIAWTCAKCNQIGRVDVFGASNGELYFECEGFPLGHKHVHAMLSAIGRRVCAGVEGAKVWQVAPPSETPLPRDRKWRADDMPPELFAEAAALAREGPRPVAGRRASKGSCCVRRRSSLARFEKAKAAILSEFFEEYRLRSFRLPATADAVKVEIGGDLGDRLSGDTLTITNKSPFPLTNITVRYRVSSEGHPDWTTELSLAELAVGASYSWTVMIEPRRANARGRAMVICDQNRPVLPPVVEEPLWR